MLSPGPPIPNAATGVGRTTATATPRRGERVVPDARPSDTAWSRRIEVRSVSLSQTLGSGRAGVTQGRRPFSVTGVGRTTTSVLGKRVASTWARVVPDARPSDIAWSQRIEVRSVSLSQTLGSGRAGPLRGAAAVGADPGAPLRAGWAGQVPRLCRLSQPVARSAGASHSKCLRPGSVARRCSLRCAAFTSLTVPASV